MFIIKTSAIAKQNKDDECSNLCLSSPLSLESVPSQSKINIFVPTWVAAQTPFVV